MSDVKDKTSSTGESKVNNSESTASPTPVNATPLSDEEIREHENTKSKLAVLRHEIASVNIINEDLSSMTPEIVDALSFDSSTASEDQLRLTSVKIQILLGKIIDLLKTKSEESTNLEKQNIALTLQTKSLKDVVSITKDLLGIRNMEVEHLHVDIKKLEENINVERQRHNNMINKMNDVIKLNQSLKTEYETQLGLFQNLKGKYEEKVTILQNENKRLGGLANPSSSQSTTETPEAELTTENPETELTTENPKAELTTENPGASSQSAESDVALPLEAEPTS